MLSHALTVTSPAPSPVPPSYTDALLVVAAGEVQTAVWEYLAMLSFQNNDSIARMGRDNSRMQDIDATAASPAHSTISDNNSTMGGAGTPTKALLRVLCLAFAHRLQATAVEQGGAASHALNSGSGGGGGGGAAGAGVGSSIHLVSGLSCAALAWRAVLSRVARGGGGRRRAVGDDASGDEAVDGDSGVAEMSDLVPLMLSPWLSRAVVAAAQRAVAAAVIPELATIYLESDVEVTGRSEMEAKYASGLLFSVCIFMYQHYKTIHDGIQLHCNPSATTSDATFISLAHALHAHFPVTHRLVAGLFTALCGPWLAHPAGADVIGGYCDVVEGIMFREAEAEAEEVEIEVDEGMGEAEAGDSHAVNKPSSSSSSSSAGASGSAATASGRPQPQPQPLSPLSPHSHSPRAISPRPLAPRMASPRGGAAAAGGAGDMFYVELGELGGYVGKIPTRYVNNNDNIDISLNMYIHTFYCFISYLPTPTAVAGPPQCLSAVPCTATRYTGRSWAPSTPRCGQ
jgi:hypothetical protein